MADDQAGRHVWEKRLRRAPDDWGDNAIRKARPGIPERALLSDRDDRIRTCDPLNPMHRAYSTTRCSTRC